MPHHPTVPRSSTGTPDSALPVPATYLRDKLRAAQIAFPHLDLHLPNNWWNMTDAETRELWEEKSKEFGFHDYTHSVRIADEMIRRYDDRAETDGLQGYRASPTLSDTTPSVSALPNNEGITNVTLSYQPPISGEATDAESSLSAPREMEASMVSSNSPPFEDGSDAASNIFISEEMGMSDKESCFSLNGEGVELASTERQDSSNGVSTTPSSPEGVFVLTLGDPADGPVRSNHSVYSPGSPSSSTAYFDLSVIGDDRWATEHLEVIGGGNFVVYKESQKEGFNIWWEQTTWAEGVNDGKHRHPHWNSNMRTALVWRKFTQVANRLTGEPRVVCKRCSSDFAHPRTARHVGALPLECHLQSIACRGAEAKIMQDANPPIKQANPVSQMLVPRRPAPYQRRDKTPPSRQFSLASSLSLAPRPKTREIVNLILEPSDHPASVMKEQSRPSYSSSPCPTRSPSGRPAPSEHETTPAPKLAETMPNPTSGKRIFPMIDAEFGAAIKRAKKEYIKKYGPTPKRASRKSQ